jgi:hypothetical protein
MALPDLARLDLGAPGAATGMYRGPNTRARQRARLASAHADPVDQALSDNNLVVEILNHIEDDEPSTACAVALKWADMLSKAHGSKFDSERVWTDLTERIFPRGDGMPFVEDPNDARRNFALICRKVHQYHTGERRLASDLERAQRPYVLASLKERPWQYELMDGILRMDRGLALAAVRASFKNLRKLDWSFLSDKDFALAVVSTPDLGQYLRYFDKALLKDRAVVLAAVKNDDGRRPPDEYLPFRYGEGSVLGMAEHEFREDEEVVMAALARNPGTLMDVRFEVRKNKAAQLVAVRGDYRMLEYANQNWDVDIVAAALVQSFDALEHVDEIVLKHPEFKELMLTYLSDKEWWKAYKYRKPRNRDSPQATDRLPAEAAEALRAIHIDLDAGVPDDPDESDGEWSLESF